jgi:hypothetical protein
MLSRQELEPPAVIGVDMCLLDPDVEVSNVLNNVGLITRSTEKLE